MTGSRRALEQPLWWAALTALVLNDHVLKGGGLLPSTLTGKLSDLAGLVVAPPLLIAALGLRSRRARVIAYLVVGLGFASLELVPAAARAIEAAVGWRVWCDPTDLVALPMLAVAWWAFERDGGAAGCRAGAWRILARRVALVAGGLACTATSYPREEISSTPYDGQSAVDPDAPIQLSFEAVEFDPERQTLTLATDDGTEVPGQVSVEEDSDGWSADVVFAPEEPLAADTDFILTLALDADDEIAYLPTCGPEVSITGDLEIAFTTASRPVALCASVVAVTGGWVVIVTLSQAIDPTTLEGAVMVLAGPDAVEVREIGYDEAPIGDGVRPHIEIALEDDGERVPDRVILDSAILGIDGTPLGGERELALDAP